MKHRPTTTDSNALPRDRDSRDCTGGRRFKVRGHILQCARNRQSSLVLERGGLVLVPPELQQNQQQWNSLEQGGRQHCHDFLRWDTKGQVAKAATQPSYSVPQGSGHRVWQDENNGGQLCNACCRSHENLCQQSSIISIIMKKYHGT